MFCRNTLILLKVCRRIYLCKILVKFDIGNYPQNFGQVLALFRQSLLLCKIQGKDSIFPQSLLKGCIDSIWSLQNGMSL